MHINKKHVAAKAERAKYSPTQPTLKIVWHKIFRRSRAGVEHYSFKPVLTRI